jgi:hypothetical protein
MLQRDIILASTEKTESKSKNDEQRITKIMINQVNRISLIFRITQSRGIRSIMIDVESHIYGNFEMLHFV